MKLTHEDSNYRLLDEQLLSHAQIPEAQVPWPPVPPVALSAESRVIAVPGAPLAVRF